jgi:hypothetical protein
MFFLYLYPHFSKMDIFKMSFFENPGIDLKFSYIITSSASALPIFAGLPLCFYLFLLYLSKREHYAANRVERVFFYKRWFGIHGTSFHKTGLSIFWGCFEYSPRPKFNLCPKIGGSCFDLFFAFLRPFFWGCFVFR